MTVLLYIYIKIKLKTRPQRNVPAYKLRNVYLV